MNKRLASMTGLATVSALALTGCFSSSSSDDDDGVAREHDQRSFEVAEQTLGFEADPEDGLSDIVQSASRYWGSYDGIQGEAGYTAEIPQDWHGGVIMWARGYGGEGEALTGVTPSVPFRNTALAAGYAWAASTYSANYYDVRAAIEDTNKLANNLTSYLEADHGESYDEPNQLLIAGGSLGGHTAAAAVERETIETAANPVTYEGAMPICQAEQNQFQWLGDYTRAAQHLAGFGDADHEDFPELVNQILPNLFAFEIVDGEPTPTWEPINDEGERLKAVAMHLTGGERPIFEEGFRNSTWQGAVIGTGGADGTVTGILARSIYDNMERDYSDALLNEEITRVPADDGVNPLRDDGVRWLPLVRGEFDVPVLTMHTLGDFYVPFVHQQLYRERAIEHENDDLLVQRAIRAPGHCDFSGAEMATAVGDFLAWVNGGDKPAGDDDAILEPETVADPQFGCEHTNDMFSQGRDDLPQCE